MPPTVRSNSSQKDQADHIYQRELELIRQGQDPETAHAVAVAEETMKKLSNTKFPNQPDSGA